MKTERQQVGKRGEDVAVEYLISKGMTIIERNWRHSHLELDIIALDTEGIHIVEVKSRMAPNTADPEVGVTAAKQRRMVSAARAFMRSRKASQLRDSELFFDVVTVVFDDAKIYVEFYPQAFIPIYV